MNLDKLKNDTLVKLRVCKRDTEAEQVINDAYKKMRSEGVKEQNRFAFWQELHERLGERNFSLLEDQAKSSVDRIAKVSRERIKKMLDHKKGD